MKKSGLFFMLALSCVLTVYAQGTGAENRQKEGNMTLIAYFSHTGTTEAVAKQIAAATGGQLFEIKTLVPYPADYNACLSKATEELRADSRPALATRVSDMSRYDVIFIGYPIWWGDTPMAIRTFLEAYDLSGKTVIPFCTSGSSGIGTSAAAVRRLCPKSKVLEGFCITGANRSRADTLVKEWVKRLGV